MSDEAIVSVCILIGNESEDDGVRRDCKIVLVLASARSVMQFAESARNVLGSLEEIGRQDGNQGVQAGGRAGKKEEERKKEFEVNESEWFEDRGTVRDRGGGGRDSFRGKSTRWALFVMVVVLCLALFGFGLN